MKKTRIALFAILCSSALWAQQDVQFTQFANNKIFYNPGVTGAGDAICLSAAHRSQWVGFDNAPTTQNFSANIPLNFLHGGLALNFTNDMIGISKTSLLALVTATKWTLRGVHSV